MGANCALRRYDFSDSQFAFSWYHVRDNERARAKLSRRMFGWTTQALAVLR